MSERTNLYERGFNDGLRAGTKSRKPPETTVTMSEDAPPEMVCPVCAGNPPTQPDDVCHACTGTGKLTRETFLLIWKSHEFMERELAPHEVTCSEHDYHGYVPCMDCEAVDPTPEQSGTEAIEGLRAEPVAFASIRMLRRLKLKGWTEGRLTVEATGATHEETCNNVALFTHPSPVHTSGEEAMTADEILRKGFDEGGELGRFREALEEIANAKRGSPSWTMEGIARKALEQKSKTLTGKLHK